MSIESMNWNKLTPEQVEVLRCLAEWGRYEERPVTTKLAETCEVEPGVAAGALASLKKHDLIRFDKGQRNWKWVELTPEAALYIKNNPYLGLTAGEAILAFLEDYGPLRGERGVAAHIARGTGFNNTTISSNLQKLADQKLVNVRRKGAKIILAAGLPGQKIPADPIPIMDINPLEPAAWVAEEFIDDEEVSRELYEEAVEHSIKLAEHQRELREQEDGLTDEEATDRFLEAVEEMERPAEPDYDTIARALLAQLIEKLSEEPEVSTDETEKMVRQISDLTIESAEKGVRIRTLEQQLADGSREYDKLRADYNELRGRYNALEERMTKTQSSIRELRDTRQKKYPIPEEARTKLAQMMKELPGGR